MAGEVWSVGGAYEEYVGRWSRHVAESFVPWLRVPAGRRWLDVGCGTGALTGSVLALADPIEVVGVDPSEGFLDVARAAIADPRSRFQRGDAQSLPFPDHSFDAVVSALVLNFVPDPSLAVSEFARVAAPGGVVAAYVWDYAEGMAMMRYLWDAAITLDPAAVELDEGRRFPTCRPGPLRRLLVDAGLDHVTTEAIDIRTTFIDFDDYWNPFLGGQGPAPAYVMSRTDEQRSNLRDLLLDRLPVDADGSISLAARAWAVRGTAADRHGGSTMQSRSGTA